MTTLDKNKFIAVIELFKMIEVFNYKTLNLKN